MSSELPADPQTVPRPRRRLGRGMWAAQAGLAALVGWFVWERISTDLSQFQALDVPAEFRPELIALAAAVVWLTYGLLIAAWRAVLSGWQQEIGFGTSVRIWCVSNLGRYLPGKVWSIAGLAVLAQRAGVKAWAAAGSAVVMQGLAIGSGAAVSLVLVSQVATAVALVAGLVIAAATVGAVMSEPLMRRLSNFAGTDVEIHPLPTRAVVLGVAATMAAWVLYGIAFWLLAKGMIPNNVPDLPVAVGSFAAGYIVGLLALFAPGGLGVREGMLVVLLGPAIGTGPALVLSIGSRILLTFTEVLAALVGLTIRTPSGGRA